MNTHPPYSPTPSDSGDTNSALDVDSTYDDQGLLFALILCGALLAFYVPLVFYFVGTSRLWLKRFYRPNHTVEPPPHMPTPHATPQPANDSCEGAAFPIHEMPESGTARAREYPSSQRSPVKHRRKRLGISLPYRSTMFHPPTWRDWISVEEHVPHLESALSTRHVTHVRAARFTGSRSYIPLSPTNQERSANPADTAGGLGSGGSPPSPTRAAHDLRPTPTSPLSPFAGGASGSYSDASAAAVGGPAARRRYGSVDPPDHCGSQPRAVVAVAPANEEPTTTATAEDSLPKTPLDPQVALYIFTLKFFTSLMLLGECFTIWISVIASQDDYNEYTMVKADTHKCHRQDANETGCLLKRPYCQYLGEDTGCSPVALHGLYDLTVKNLSPGSWRWWPVVLLNCGFCLVLVALTVFYVSRVNRYVHDVMLHQMKHALGYRVACVRGIDADEMKSITVFSSSFLQERSYFLPRRGEHRAARPAGGSGSGGGGGGSSTGTYPASGGGGRRREVDSAADGQRLGSPTTATDLTRRSSIEDEFDYYEQVDCNGLDCLFGIVGCHYYTTHRDDAVFTRPGKVKQILFTRKPPAGMYAAISDAEKAMADMQDVVADEKAVKRKLRRRQLRAMAEAHQQQQQQQQQQGGGAAAEAPPATMPAAPAVRSASPPGTQPASHTKRRFVPNRSNLNVALLSFAGRLSATSSSTTSPASSVASASLEPPPESPTSPPAAESALTTVTESSPTGRVSGAAAKTGGASGGGGERSSRVYTDESVLNVEDNVEDLILYTRSCTWATCCEYVPAIPYYEQRLRAAGTKLNKLLAEVPQQPADSATFVIFADARSAFEFINLFRARYGGWTTSAVANIAGPPGQIISNNVLTDKVVLGIRYFLVFVAYVVLVFSYSIPIGMLGSLENLSYMPGVGASFSEYYVQNVPAWLRNIINAYLPVLALSLFYVILPDILRVMVLIMGAFNKAECDAGQLYMQYIFMVLTAVIFQAALQGGFAQLAFLVSAGEGRLITEFFVACVTPSKASYFYAKVLIAISFSAWNDLVDPVGILKAFLLRSHVHVQRNYDALFMPCEMEYPKRYSFDLMILAIGLLFHMTMPLLGLFVGIYFIMRYVTQRAKLYDRYRPTLSPAQDCTDFTVCAQVLRCVMWLYCLAETGGVLLLSLREHTGGVIVCSMTLGTGMLLLIYVHLQTRKWMATLGRAREFSRELAEEKAVRRQQQQQRSSPTARGAPSGQASTTNSVSMPGSFSSIPVTVAGAEADELVAAAATDEGATMDSYENLRFTLFDDSHSNPFIGYLLPRIPDVSCRYQPKHQRLAPLDVDAELTKMMQSVFVVERYWDKGMTYFEADVEEAKNHGVADVSRGRQSGGGAGAGASAAPSRSPQTLLKTHRAHDIVIEGSTTAVQGDSHIERPVAPRPAAGTGTHASPVEMEVISNESVLSPMQRRLQLESEILRESIVISPHAVTPAQGARATADGDGEEASASDGRG